MLSHLRPGYQLKYSKKEKSLLEKVYLISKVLKVIKPHNRTARQKFLIKKRQYRIILIKQHLHQ